MMMDESLDSIFGIGGEFRQGDKETKRVPFSASDASSQLVELGNSKSVRIFNNHKRSIRNINSNLNQTTGNQNIQFTMQKKVHNGFFFLGRLLSMERSNFSMGQELSCNFVIDGHHRFEV